MSLAQPAYERDQLSQRGILILRGHPSPRLLFQGEQGGEPTLLAPVRPDGQEASVLCTLHCCVPPAQEDEAGAGPSEGELLQTLPTFLPSL